MRKLKRLKSTIRNIVEDWSHLLRHRWGYYLEHIKYDGDVEYLVLLHGRRRTPTYIAKTREGRIFICPREELPLAVRERLQKMLPHLRRIKRHLKEILDKEGL